MNDSMFGDTGSCAHQLTETMNLQTKPSSNNRPQAHATIVLNANIRAEIMNRAYQQRNEMVKKADSNLAREGPGGTAGDSSSQLLYVTQPSGAVAFQSPTSFFGGTS